jgi:hypothetical protein
MRLALVNQIFIRRHRAQGDDPMNVLRVLAHIESDNRCAPGQTDCLFTLADHPTKEAHILRAGEVTLDRT